MNWVQSLINSLKKKRKTTERQYFRSIVAVVVFSAIVIVFIMFGYTGRQSGSGQLARVGNHYVSIQEYQTEIERMQRMYSGMFGGQMNAETQRQFFQNQALESLISQEVLYQAAIRNGILVSDDEIRDLIFHDIPAFQDNGKFDKERYFAVLEANHFTASEFESKLKQEKVTEKLRALFDESFVPNQLAAEKQKALQSATRRYSWVIFDEAIAKKKLDKTASSAVNSSQSSPDIKPGASIPGVTAAGGAAEGEKSAEWTKTWDAYLQKVDADVKNKDTTALDADLASAGLTWTTEDVNLSQDGLPKLANPVASRRAFELKTPGQYSGLIQDNARKILVQLKDVAAESSRSKKDLATKLADTAPSETDQKSEKSNEAFSAWLENQKAATKIERNYTLLSSLR